MQISHFWNWNQAARNNWQEVMERFAACGHCSLAMPAELALNVAFDNSFCRYLQKITAAAGVAFDGVHAPFGGEWDLLCEDPDFAPVSRYVHLRLLEILPDEFGIDTYTMHLKNDLFTGSQQEADEMLARNLEELLAVAERKGTVIAIENGFQAIDLPETISRYMELLASDNLGCCLDVAHANVIAARSGRDITEYISLLLPHIAVCHLHDNDGTADQHLLPGRGSLDWQKCMPMLAAAPRLRSLQNESNSTGVPVEEICAVVDRVLLQPISCQQ